jgi:DNA-binding response OmpR family regulator
VLSRLSEIGLAFGISEPAAPGARPVLILEPDVEGFQRPLEALLRSRDEGSSLVSLADERDLLGAIRRAHPRVVILNSAVTGDAMEPTARAVRRTSDLDDVALVAVLESDESRDAASLRAAGFDAVFVKPVPYAELERIIG